MHNHHRTTALDLMMSLMPSVREVIEAIAVHDKNLADEARRAATSVISNHAEADGVTRGHRRERIETAYGSLCELRRQLKLAAAWDYVPMERVLTLDEGLDRVGALTWRRSRAAT